jgi:hypothetical protein
LALILMIERQVPVGEDMFDLVAYIDTFQGIASHNLIHEISESEKPPSVLQLSSVQAYRVVTLLAGSAGLRRS